MQRSISLSGTRPVRRQRSSIKRSKSLQKSYHPQLYEDCSELTRGPFPKEVFAHPKSSSSYEAEPIEIDLEVDLTASQPAVPSNMPALVDSSSQLNTAEIVDLTSPSPEREAAPSNFNDGFVKPTADSNIDILTEKISIEAAIPRSPTVPASPCIVQSGEDTPQMTVESTALLRIEVSQLQEGALSEEVVTETGSAHISVLQDDLELPDGKAPPSVDEISSKPDDVFEHVSHTESPTLTNETTIIIPNDVSFENPQQEVVCSIPLDKHNEVSFDDESKADSFHETIQIDLQTDDSQLPERLNPLSCSPPTVLTTATHGSLESEETEKDLSTNLLEENKHQESIDQSTHTQQTPLDVTEQVFEEFVGEPESKEDVVVREGQDLICFSPGATLIDPLEGHTSVMTESEDVQQADTSILEVPEASPLSASAQDLITEDYPDLKTDEIVIDEICSDDESDSDQSIQEVAPARPVGRFSALMPVDKPILVESDIDISLAWPISQNVKEPPTCNQESESPSQLTPSSPVPRKRKISTPLDSNPMAIKKLKQPFRCPLITDKTSDKLPTPDSSQLTASSPAPSSPTPLAEPQPLLVQRSRPLSFKPLTIRSTVQYQVLRNKLGLCSTSKDQDDGPASEQSVPKEPDPELETKPRLTPKRNPFATLKASAPFVSPVTAASSSTEKATVSLGGVGKVTQREVAKLESKVQMIKQAMRLVEGAGRVQEEKQEELIKKWKEAGREISQLLWDEGGSANPADNFQALDSNPFSSSPPTSSFFPSDAFSSFPRQSFFSDSIFSDSALRPITEDSNDKYGEAGRRERSLSVDSPIGSPRPSRSGREGLGMSAQRQVRGYLESFDKAMSERKHSFDKSTADKNDAMDSKQEEEEEEEEDKREEEQDEGWDVGRMLRTVFRTDPTLFGWKNSLADWEE